MRTQTTALLALLFAVGLLMATPVAAQAQPTQAGPGFGQHVSHCAQTMGLNAHHNPGMHHGTQGWDGEPC